MTRNRGLSARLKLTIGYAGFLFVAGALLPAVVWVFLLRRVPDSDKSLLGLAPNRDVLLRVFAPAAAGGPAFLLASGLLGGWVPAGRMLAPLTRIADAARMATNGSLSHRICLEGPENEFRELSDAFDTMLEQLESHVAEQLRFAANTSHELRTPWPSHGRCSTSPAMTSTCPYVAEDTAETPLPLAEQRRTTLDVTGTTARTTGSPELLSRMVTNLVQNAIVHNLPTDGTLDLTPRPTGGLLATIRLPGGPPD